MDDTKSDILMRFVDKDGKDIYAESALGVAKADVLAEGFSPASYDNYSNFFEVQNFGFTLAVKPQDENVGALSRPNAAAAGNRAQAATDQFSRWRSAKDDEYKKIRFPIEFDTFTFTRLIDAASPIFFNACCNQESFRSAALVKRVSTGPRGTDGQSMGFLRIDFRDVLLTGVNWDDGDMVTENCTFICKAMRVRYRQQTADSSLLPPTEATWDQAKDGTANNGGGG